MPIVVLDGYTLNPGDNPWDELARLGAAPGALSLSVNPGALKSGNYYALIKFTAPAAVNNPQFFAAMLAVADEGSPPDPDPTPSGLFFVGRATGAS